MSTANPTSTATAKKVRRPSTRPVWMEPIGPVEKVLRALALALVAFLVLYPFWTVLVTSLASQVEITKGGGLVAWTNHPTLESYTAVLGGGVVTRALGVSLGLTIVGTAINLLLTIMMAYALSRPDTFGHRPILLLALFTMLFSAGIIPNFLVVRSLGLLNTFAALILPGAISAFNLVVMRNFFMGIPAELIESARIDGAGDIAILTRIMLPLSKAVVAVVGLFYAVEHWNSFFLALLYLNDNAKWPLSLVLRAYVLQGQPAVVSVSNYDSPPPAVSIQMAVVILAMLPILLVYPFVQKYFSKGVLTGAIKG